MGNNLKRFVALMLSLIMAFSFVPNTIMATGSVNLWNPAGGDAPVVSGDMSGVNLWGGDPLDPPSTDVNLWEGAEIVDDELNADLDIWNDPSEDEDDSQSVDLQGDESQVLNSDAPVAKVTTAQGVSTEYSSIDEAIAAWTNGTTLTLLANVNLTDVISLKSTEYHILDLSKYTMTAATNKDAIQITAEGRSSASYALDIKADATNPGGITATGKAVVRTTGKSGVKDRPIIRFYNGVFNGSYVVYHSGSNGTNCPQFYFYDGVYNATSNAVNTNRSLNIFYGGTFNANLHMSVDSSAYGLVTGGRFKQLKNSFMSTLSSSKFTIGSAKGTYDRYVYVDDEGYYVVSATDVAATEVEVSVAMNPTSSNYFYYSTVKDAGAMKYTDAEVALANNTSSSTRVTLAVDSVDLTGIAFKGTMIYPTEANTFTVTFAEGQTVGWKVEFADMATGKQVYYRDTIVNGVVTREYYTDYPPVAKIGETNYTSLAEAVSAANDGDTITIIADFSVADSEIINKNVTINLNNYTISAASILTNKPVIRVLAEVTVTGGTVDGTTGINSYAFIVGNGDTAGNLTITDGTYKGISSVASVTKGTLTINGGTYSTAHDGEGEDCGSDFVLNCIDANYNNGTAVIKVQGGTYVGFNPADNVAETAGTNFVVEGYISETADNGATYTVRKTNYVAQLGETKYESLAEAVSAANDGDTITIIADYSVDDSEIINKNVTLDLDGHTISAAEALTNKPVIRVLANVTVTGGTVDGTTGINSYAFIVGNGETAGSLTITDGTYKGISSVASVTKGILTINGGTYSTAHDGEGEDCGSDFVLNCIDANYNNGTAVIKVQGGTYVGFNPANNVAETEGTNFVVDGYVSVKNGDSYTVNKLIATVEAEVIPGVWGKTYISPDNLADLVAALGANTNVPVKVTVNESFNVAETLVVAGDKTVELNLNGKTLTGVATNDVPVYPVIRVQEGATVIVNGNGNIVNDDYIFTLGSSDKTTAGNLIIENGTFVAETSVASVTNGLLTVKGGNFSVTNDPQYLLNCYDESYRNGIADIEVMGGLFTGYNPEFSTSENPKANFCADGYYAEDDDADNVWEVVEGAVARNMTTDVSYKNLTVALNAAAQGDTIKVVGNCEETILMVPAGITLDLNGKYVTVSYGVLGFGDIIDTAKEVGGIKISNDTMAARTSLSTTNAGYLPIYDTDASCYRFYKYELINLGSKPIDNNPNACRYGVRFVFENIEAYKLIATTDDSGLKMNFELSWTNAKTPVSLEFKEETLVQFAEAAYDQLTKNGEMSKAIMMNVYGLDKLGEGVTLTTSVTLSSATNVTSVKTDSNV